MVAVQLQHQKAMNNVPLLHSLKTNVEVFSDACESFCFLFSTLHFHIERLSLAVSFFFSLINDAVTFNEGYGLSF